MRARPDADGRRCHLGRSRIGQSFMSASDRQPYARWTRMRAAYYMPPVAPKWAYAPITPTAERRQRILRHPTYLPLHVTQAAFTAFR